MKKDEQSITVEQIILGEVMGREALEFFAQTGEYVFHGSWQKHDKLELQQSYSDEKPDGAPAVCASGNYEVAIFKSLVNTPMCKTRKRVSGWSTNKGGGFTFSATESALESAEAENAVGYVHVFKKADLERYRGVEYRTDKEISPLFVIEVKKVDLPKDIKILK